MKKQTGQRTVSQALKELEVIVESLSQDEVDVEKGMSKFKEGVELVKFCKSELKKTENEFHQIKSELLLDE